jgi:hypothetical protein
MRTQALILLIPFSVFLTETASYIPAMNDACTIVAAEKSACSTTKKQDHCSGKKEKSSCTKTKKQDECAGKKGNNKKSPDNKCKDNADCTTCPVCYTFIFQSQYEWQVKEFVSGKNYSLLTPSYIYSYTADVWKPPNGFTGFL